MNVEDVLKVHLGSVTFMPHALDHLLHDVGGDPEDDAPVASCTSDSDHTGDQVNFIAHCTEKRLGRSSPAELCGALGKF
ncbi:xaa-Pro dipeptidase-like, partial [Tachysurus ichikawai]